MIDKFIRVTKVELRLSPSTQAAYKDDLLAFAAHIAPKAFQDAKSADVATAQEGKDTYLKAVLDAADTDIKSYISTCVAPRSQARRLTTLRQFYKFLCNYGHRSDNPAEAIKMPRLPAAPIKYLSESQVDALFAAAPSISPKASAGLHILYSTGMRVAEMLTLPADAIDLDNEVLKINGKGRKERVVILSAPARAAAQALYQGTTRTAPADAAPRPSPAPSAAPGYLFAGRDKSRPMTRQGFSQLLKQVAVAAQVDPKALSPHVLRHSFASHMVARGADLRMLQKLLGHADIATTQLYTHVQPANVERVIKLTHPLSTAA